ncbi:MAG: hypothetical protein A2958_02485 [Candidatus Levybacteria bacterium RIFCSPLOWO2_01_FULL_38_13]|nr:MAG: hypothetical protein A2629_02905 [Candidatus Levybacteria bacterium RIFCSPHIGHO2_01_FULL_41_15]OGH35205.1 MAG: hypothetical protein A2958_02485 [Candidatus Levybacteria bacterium RIFCSPLOWO2_01_FULL_38_13]
MGPIFFEITLIISLAALLSLLFRVFKQPAILAYILAGIIIGPFGRLQLQSLDFLQAMAEFGITFLLFMLGMELRFKDLKSVGKISLLTGIAQIIFTSVIGFFIAGALGFSGIESLYISIALTFSSTVIIVKLLSDKKDLNSLYGKISVGFLLVQDFFAILILMFLSGFANGGVLPSDFIVVFLKAVLLFALVIYLSKSFLPKLIDLVAKSSETLFLFSIAFALSMSALVSTIGFSIEIGGFLAGLALANSSEHFQIQARTRALRDFFVTIFFVILGMSMTFGDIANVLTAAIVLSVFVLIGNPIIVMVIMGVMGYRSRTSFMAGLTVAQISEFSLILVFLGNRIGHLTSEIVSLVTVVGVITFTLSTYMILGARDLYKFLSPYLGSLEMRGGKRVIPEDEDGIPNLKNHVVVIGGDQMGQSVLSALDEMNIDVVLVDLDPDIVRRFEGKAHKLFGDIADLDIQERASLDSARLVISTIPDVEDNFLILKELKHENRRAKIVVMALDTEEARQLYKAGADYVVLPHLAGGRQIAKLIEDNNLDKIESLRNKDVKFLGLTD